MAMIPILVAAKQVDFFTVEHIHVLINHLPVMGTVLGAITIVVALLLRNRSAQIVALIVVLVAALSAIPVIMTGQRAFDPVEGIADDDGVEWLATHMERAEKAEPAFYALIVLSAVALLAPLKWPRSAVPLTIATLVVTVCCAAASFWIAVAGGEIRHPEFRTGSPPPHEESEEHHHTH
jgi:hypothetical protein